MLVIDTSVAVKWVVPEQEALIEANSDLALDLLSRGLIAPDCIAGEFANALFKKVRRKEIGEEQARKSLAILPDLVTFVPTPPLIDDALHLAFELGHPVHDCTYLVLAQRLESILVTADHKFVAMCRTQNPHARTAQLDEPELWRTY